MATPDVIIVGGGIVGAACARALAVRGEHVLVFDAGHTEGGATIASAGMLAPLAEAADSKMLAFSVRARDYYCELVPELEEETGIDLDHWPGGITMAVFEDEEVARHKSAVARLRQLGFAADWLSDDEVRERHPGISPEVAGGLLAFEDGAIEPLMLQRALFQSAQEKGAEIERGVKVSGIASSRGKATGVITDGGERDAGAVVIAAGCWSGRLTGLPRPLSVEPIKGEMAALPWPEDEPRAVVYGGKGYLLQRGGEALAGSTMEYVGFDAKVTEAGIEHVTSNAARLFPALRDAEVLRTWCGLRPGTPDGHPFIGADPELRELWYATGHGRNGILLAGFTGELIGQLYRGEFSADDHEDLDLEPVDPARFWRRTH